MFGQHTEEVLMKTLGYDWDGIAQLKEKEII
jgi:crotonobetainyl-CoA:carnitine CoA-transferase CaiB-like acyl-CoA transferase